tara:strand:- start:451 stop:1176 length:726 start_codon:yes stop_codon:yes gene_type:complete
MQEYSTSDSLNNDLIRMSFSNSNQVVKKEQQNSNVFLRNSKPNDLITPLNNKINNSNDLNTYNNEINRLNTMSQEILDKDKELQELKNLLQQSKMEMDAVKLNRNMQDQIELENKLLKEKLQKEYNKNDEYLEMKHSLEKMKHQKGRLQDNISSLEIIIRKQFHEITEIKEELLIKKEPTVNTIVSEKKYKNNTLKKTLLEHNNDYTEQIIDDLFDEMEITEDINITKDLLMNIINYLNSE